VLDPSVRVVPLRQEQLQERLGERFRELDVPLLVEWPDGRRAALVFVIEAETEPGRFSIHRLAHYCLDIAELVGTERVVPVVIFLRRGAAPRHLELAGTRNTYLTFRYLACTLAEEPAARHTDSPNLVARVNLPNMAHSREVRVAVYREAVRGLLTLETDRDKQLKYLDFIDGYAALDDNERQRFEREYPQEAERVATFSERYLDQGRIEGQADALLHQLTLKFGELTEEQLTRIENADVDTLRTWFERLLNARSIDEALQGPDGQGAQFEQEHPQETKGVAAFSGHYIQKGVKQGESRLLLRLLTLKFGEPTPAQRARIEGADADTLLSWSERVLTAGSIEEVLH
jgi:hypothetical protein